LKIERDDDPLNPVKEYDSAGKMFLFHRRYDLGHDHDFTQDTFLFKDEFGGEYDDHYTDDREGLEKWIKDKKILAVPVYGYDHGGLTIRAESPGSWDHWDSGCLGYVCISPDKIREEWGKGKNAYQKAKKCLISEIKTYDDYLTGNCWGYIVKDKETGDTLDSCWGFLGDEEYAQEEGESVARFHNRKIAALHGQKTRRTRKAKDTLDYSLSLPVQTI
jgi:hypothetical protein